MGLKEDWHGRAPKKPGLKLSNIIITETGFYLRVAWR
jgi:hypothetical protein